MDYSPSGTRSPQGALRSRAHVAGCLTDAASEVIPIDDTATSGRVGTLTLGLVAAPGVAEELARELAKDLPAEFGARVSDEFAWSIPVVTDEFAAHAGVGTAVIDAARERMLRERWNLAVVLTDLPLRIGRRPVVADASATHGVAVISLPALGAVQLRRRVRDAVVRLVDGLMGESLELGRREGAARRQRVGRRLAELVGTERRLEPEDEGIDVRVVAAAVRGNARLLVGMLRANRPWRLIARLSRALVAAVAGVVFALATSDIWRLADALGPLRLGALTVISLAAIVAFLIVAHGLWSRPAGDAAREQAILFNVVTTLTLIIGVVSLYLALFVLALAGAGLTLDQHVLSQALGHHATFVSYLKITWMVSSLATVAGALGSGLESDATVREAAYGYVPERQTELERVSLAQERPTPDRAAATRG